MGLMAALVVALVLAAGAAPLRAASACEGKPANLNFTFPILQGRGNNRLLDAYKVTVLPTSFIVSPAGTVSATHVGAASKASFEADIRAVLSSSAR